MWEGERWVGGWVGRVGGWVSGCGAVGGWVGGCFRVLFQLDS